ncbi:reverse transcriptase domain-containing protein [Tanacetum coccineum]
MYEHCFRNLDVNIRSRLRRCKAPMTGFSKERYHPLGVIDLRVTMGSEGRSKTMLIEFAIVKCHLPYNLIIGRTGMRSLGAVGSTIHSMIKFPTNQGVVTMETSREALRECKHLERVKGSWKEVQWRQREEKMSRIRDQERPNQYVTMGSTLTTNYKQLLADVVRENIHVSASGGRIRASIFNGISVQMFPPTSKRMQPNKNGERGRRKDWVSYRRRSILFHPHAERIKELRYYTSEDDGKGKEAIKEGLGIRIILVSPKEKMCSYAIRLKFKASNYTMDYEALLAGLAASANQGMKDLHVFIDSLTLVAQVLNHTSPKNLEPKSRSVNRVGNYKPGIPQTGSIGRYQNKTIGRRDKQQQERENNKQCTRNKTKMQP